MQMHVGVGKTSLKFPQEYFPYENIVDGHDDIHMRLILIKQKTSFALIDVELPSVRPFSLIDELRDYAADQLDIPMHSVWFLVTHNMTAPHVPQEQEPEGAAKKKMHMDMLYGALDTVCRQALDSMQPAKFGFGTGQCDVNCNRDILTNQGWWHGKNPDGISDKTLNVLRFDDLRGRPIAIVYQYAVKSAVADDEIMSDGHRHYSSELTGRACQLVEEATGAVTFYIMGAAGDQVPKKVAKYARTDENGELQEVHLGDIAFQWIEELGTELGNAVLETANAIACQETAPGLEIISMRMTFPGQRFVPVELAHRPVMDYQYLPKEDTCLDVELLRLGSIALIGVKPEFTCITGMQLREVSPFAHTILASMVNGGQGYMADKSAYERKTFSALHSEYACGGAEAFVKWIGTVLNALVQN